MRDEIGERHVSRLRLMLTGADSLAISIFGTMCIGSVRQSRSAPMNISRRRSGTHAERRERGRHEPEVSAQNRPEGAYLPVVRATQPEDRQPLRASVQDHGQRSLPVVLGHSPCANAERQQKGRRNEGMTGVGSQTLRSLSTASWEPVN